MKNEILRALRGVATVPQMRAIRREYSKRIDDPLPLALELMHHGDMARFFAYELVQKLPLTAREVKQLGEGIDSWQTADAFAMFVSGPAFLRGDLAVDDWARSSDRWMRRAALATLVPAARAAGNTERVLRICAMLAGDRDDMVVKALSWALRELSKRDPKAVKTFLETHDVAPRVKREVVNKLTTGLKTPRRSS
jgi:3-methyladenine DNA glycosylase AlkD